MKHSLLSHPSVGRFDIRSAAWLLLAVALFPREPIRGFTAERGSPGKEKPLAATSDRLTQALSEFNRGAGVLDAYEYAKAAREFEKVVAMFSDWTAARYNLGLAYLNMGGEKSSQAGERPEANVPKESDPDAHSDVYWRKAKEAFEEVLRAEPKTSTPTLP